MATENPSNDGPRQFAFMITDLEASAKGRRRVRVSRACDRCKQSRDSNSHGHSGNDNAVNEDSEAGIEACPDVATERPRESASRASPDGPTTDMQGHYVGPASGLSFLVRIQKRLLASDPSSPSSTTFTFGDAPLPDYGPVPSVMLSSEAASALVARFFDYTMPVDRFLHRPTIESWLSEFLRTMGDMDNADTDEARDRCAVLWMVFAMAQEHMEQSVSDDISAYYLDTYLTMALGRPPIFHNEDIDQELPSDADDDELQAAFYKLARIQNRILRDLYPIWPLSDAQQYTLASQYAEKLAEWRSDLPAYLSVDRKDTVPLIPIFQRQRDTLSIAYWHSIILTQRPFLLSSFGSVRAGFETQVANGVKQCIEAALEAAGLGSFYFGFTAVVVLYVYTIQEASSRSEVYQAYWDAGKRCHEQLERVTNPKHIGARYCLVLDMLQLEAKRKLEGAPSPFPVIPPDWYSNGNSFVMPTEAHTNTNTINNNGENGDNGNMEGVESYQQQPVEWQSIDWTNWIEFESMVSTSLF
ncbi:hypothetical protein SEUCBS140593_008658 [Sporothrix eucalyptigena]|uniref:Xylanolytic transcriptional activator regulatory domain-containing protein n=1 Tax=Sporothrix eucalyptigena TaxID=1812306 RepID=A0ABP0CNE4_9PEZI